MDALSFVLGISGHHIRSANLKELIYHRGLAKTTDATGSLDDANKENTSSNVQSTNAKTVSKKPKRGRRGQAADDPEVDEGANFVGDIADTARVSAHYESSNGASYVFSRRYTLVYTIFKLF